MTKPPRRTAEPNSAKLKLVRDLAAIMEETGLVELTLDDETVSVHLSKAAGQMPVSAPQTATPAAPSSTTEPAPTTSTTKDTDNAISSPMVGTAYLAPEPGAPSFVAEGDSVRAGQTLLIIEAMKVMNPITAPGNGTVRRILVENGQPVEYGQPLIVVE